MRITLAKLLLQQPSLLLLDEPTNHLDLDSLQWLEEYLTAYQGAVMIVSHDSRFLDNMTSRTLELSRGNLAEYPGNYSEYLRLKEARLEQQMAAFKNQEREIRQTERFIERFRYKATKARQVQSRIKRLEKLERVEVVEGESGIRLAFPPAPPSGRSVMELRGVTKRYGSLEVFRDLLFDIDRGDRVAFVGANGQGKSTLSRILAGVEPFDAGERVVGHNVTVAYFAQHQAEELDPRKEVLQTLDDVASGEVRTKLRTILGCFLFHGDDVFKKVGVLSGGEKSRLALAKMLLSPSNLLVLDEPTNHLDMRSKSVLQEALEEYEGSMVIVSHDRDFLDPLVNKVVEFRDGRIKAMPGNVTEYLEARERAAASEAPAAGMRQVRSARERKRIEAEERQSRYRRIQPVRTEIRELERAIANKEREKSAIEHNMADPEFYKDGGKVRDAAARYKELEEELSEALSRWAKLSEEMQRLQGE